MNIPEILCHLHLCMVNSSKPVTVRNQFYSVDTFKIIPSLAKAVVMFIDDAFLKKYLLMQHRIQE